MRARPSDGGCRWLQAAFVLRMAVCFVLKDAAEMRGTACVVNRSAHFVLDLLNSIIQDMVFCIEVY